MSNFYSPVEREVKCQRCQGNGSITWQTGNFTDEMAYKIHVLMRTGKEPKTWRELLKFARSEYKRGQECPDCWGNGVIDG